MACTIPRQPAEASLAGGAMAGILGGNVVYAERRMSMSGERLVIVGGDAAGMSAASQARRRRPDLEIVVFESTPFTSYSN